MDTFGGLEHRIRADKLEILSSLSFLDQFMFHVINEIQNKM